MLFTSRETSELIKYAANAFLATKITFINEMADICEARRRQCAGCGAPASAWMAASGRNFFMPDRAMADRAFPKDTVALMKTAQDVWRAIAHRGSCGQRQ